MKNKIIILIILLFIIFAFYIANNRILFKMTGQSWNSGYHSWGYTIDFNGIISEYKDKTIIKSAKITKEELYQLKKLANKVKNSYKEEKSVFTSYDYPYIEYKIYNPRLLRWIILRTKSADSFGQNDTETSEEILKLTNDLYNKYIK